MTIYTYNENCVRAGAVDVGYDPEDHDQVDADGCDGDHTAHIGKEEDIVAVQIETLKIADNGRNRFSRKTAKAILEYLRPGGYDWDGNAVPADVEEAD